MQFLQWFVTCRGWVKFVAVKDKKLWANETYMTMEIMTELEQVNSQEGKIMYIIPS